MVLPLYSVIVPVFNSEKTLEELCERILALQDKEELRIEILLVNDGSEDESENLVRELCKKHKGKITGITLSKNCGQHKALLCGIQNCYGDFAITIDDDLQYYPEDIALLIANQKQTNADVVYGVHGQKRHGLLHNAGSHAVAKIFEKYAHIPQKGSSFKLITRHVIDRVKDYNHPYVFLDEILGWYSRHTSYEPIRHENRKEGISGYSTTKLITYAIQIILSYTTLPLRLITWFGLTAFFVCLIIIIYFIYMKYTYGAEIGFTALIVSIIMSTGLILFSIGIIGEYISRLFVIQTGRPLFVIKEIVK
jgi:glycosyltransferase involved in cell wall biosynthesis